MKERLRTLAFVQKNNRIFCCTNTTTSELKRKHLLDRNYLTAFFHYNYHYLNKRIMSLYITNTIRSIRTTNPMK